jgi:hypothetical protein
MLAAGARRCSSYRCRHAARHTTTPHLTPSPPPAARRRRCRLWCTAAIPVRTSITSGAAQRSRSITVAFGLGGLYVHGERGRAVAVCTTERTWCVEGGGGVQLESVGAHCAALPNTHRRLHAACAAALVPPVCHRRAHAGGTALQLRVRCVTSSEQSPHIWITAPLEWLHTGSSLHSLLLLHRTPLLGEPWRGAGHVRGCGRRLCSGTGSLDERTEHWAAASQTQGKWESCTSVSLTPFPSHTRERLDWLRLAPDRGAWAAAAPSGVLETCLAQVIGTLCPYGL